MSVKLNIEELKEQYVNKTLNLLTVLDVFRNYKNKIMFKCQCKCGNIKNIQMSSAISGHTKSCGCYKKSDEFIAQATSWMNDIQKKTLAAEKRKQTFKENPSIQTSINNKHKQWRCNNPDKVSNINKHIAEFYTKQRKDADYSDLLHVLHDDYISSLLNGTLKTTDIIKTKCPICGNYDEHIFHNVWFLKSCKFRTGNPPICKICNNLKLTSSYEQEISDYISTFYNGKLIRNTRDIISPQELDLYYPDKKIAIEFNGDYFHSHILKEHDYHINKFKKCNKNNVLLVSIFESEWNKNKDAIKKYLQDLFNDKENRLSFNEDHTLMNNNYPSKYTIISDEIFEYSYNVSSQNRALIINTCGFSKIVTNI